MKTFSLPVNETWYLVATTEENAASCPCRTTRVVENDNPSIKDAKTYLRTERCVTSATKTKVLTSWSGFTVDGGKVLLEAPVLSSMFGKPTEGPVAEHVVFDRVVSNENTFLFTFACREGVDGSSALRVYTRDSAVMPWEKDLMDVIKSSLASRNATFSVNVTNLSLSASDQWNHCNASLPMGECGKFYGICEDNTDCCKSMGIGRGHFCDTCD